ncbi:MAG TPA: MOSC domain-containing protein [Actinomycetes bacterium]|nr:MOSC domain-containing protein [Actinomycetes bacterium]
MGKLPSPGGPAAEIASLNVGTPRLVEWRGQQVRTAIWKHPVPGPIRVEGVNLSGDDQADRTVHGGPDKAVYAYALEDLEWWATRLGPTVQPGLMGENLTTLGMPVTQAVVGEHWHIGTAVLQVAQPRIPCYKLGIRLGDPRFPRRFAAAGRPGAYLRILVPGEISPGDPVTVSHRPAHGLTVDHVARAYNTDHGLAADLVRVPELAADWHTWAVKRIQARSRQPERARPG